MRADQPSRAGADSPPVGLLGPKIYPLNGTTAFNQLTTGGTNGAYTVGPNYNMVTVLAHPMWAISLPP